MAKKITPVKSRRLKFKLPKINPAPVAGIFVATAVLCFFNAQLITAQIMTYIAPADVLAVDYTLQNSAIVDPTETKLVIPKIAVNAPVVYGMVKVEDQHVQKALENGVLHFG